MTDWVRLWHDMPTDPKWRVVARKSGQPLPCVLAVFTLMMTNASANAAERGSLLAWDHEDAGAALDMDAADVEAIFDAMQGKVLDGNRLTGWERRQPKREDTSTERVAKHRKAKAKAMKRDETQCNAPEKSREDTELSEANASAPLAAEPVDPVERVWTIGTALLVEMGMPVSRAKSSIGKWLKEVGDDAGRVLAAIQRAREMGTKDPFSLVSRIIKSSNGASNGQRSHGKPSKMDDKFTAMAGVFCDGDEPGLPPEDTGWDGFDAGQAGRGGEPRGRLQALPHPRHEARDWGDGYAPSRRLSG